MLETTICLFVFLVIPFYNICAFNYDTLLISRFYGFVCNQYIHVCASAFKIKLCVFMVHSILSSPLFFYRFSFSPRKDMRTRSNERSIRFYCRIIIFFLRCIFKFTYCVARYCKSWALIESFIFSTMTHHFVWLCRWTVFIFFKTNSLIRLIHVLNFP